MQLLEMVHSCDCGDAQTIAALKREKILSLAQLKGLSKVDSKEALRSDLGMALGHAKNLLYYTLSKPLSDFSEYQIGNE